MIESAVDLKDDAGEMEMVKLPNKDEANTEVKSSRHPPSFFTDDKGNLKFVNLVVRNPCTVFFAFLFLAIFLCFLLAAFILDGLPFTEPGFEYDVYDARSKAYDSLKLAADEVKSDRDVLKKQGKKESRIQENDLDYTYWIWESETEEGLFGTKNSIKAMKENMDLFMKDDNYDKYCRIDYRKSSNTFGECLTPLSNLNMFYPSSWNVTKVQTVIDILETDYPKNVELYNNNVQCVLGIAQNNTQFCTGEEDDKDIERVTLLTNDIYAITEEWDLSGELNPDTIGQTNLFAAYLKELNTWRGVVDFGFDTGFSIENPVSKYSRAILFWGSPLNITDDETSSIENDDEEELETKYTELLKTYVVDNFLEKMNKYTKMSYSDEINSYYFMGILIFEVLLEIVTMDGMLAIFSIVFVFLYVRLQVRSWFLALVGMIEILLSLPVAWFLFAGVFQIEFFSFLNTLCIFLVAAIGADDIFIFIDAYRQSAYHQDPAVLESLESRMSWVYRRTGTAMAITSATTCCAFLCTLLSPLAGNKSFGIFAALVILVDYIFVMTLFCTAVVIYHNKFEKDVCCCDIFSSCKSRCKNSNPSPTTIASEKMTANDEPVQDRDRVSTFFREKVFGLIKSPMKRAIIGVLLGAWLIISLVNAMKLEPTKETEQFLDKDHPLQKSVKILENEFPIAEDDINLQVYFSWGLDEVDRKGVNQLFKPEFVGEPVFSKDFKFDQNCQTAMLVACEELRNNDDLAPYIKRVGAVGSVSCFVEELGAYAKLGSLSDCDAVKSREWKDDNDWQVSPSDLTKMMEGFIDQKSCFSDNEDTILTYYADALGWDGSSLKYAAITVENQVLDPFGTKSEPVARKQYDKMIELADKLTTDMVGVCGVGPRMTDLDQKFIFMNTQSIYVRSAVQSSVLGVFIAFAVLLMSTRVFHIALFASLSIMSVLLSIIGTMVVLGWSLGSIEAILISIVAGFSVDYVVHLAHSYNHSSGDTYERLQSAFSEMGSSVLNGMVTSVGASIPLFFCQLQFFKKFGTFLCLTIAYSWIFANFGFMSLLAQAKLPLKEKKACINL